MTSIFSMLTCMLDAKEQDSYARKYKEGISTKNMLSQPTSSGSFFKGTGSRDKWMVQSSISNAAVFFFFFSEAPAI
jgi:hypothetical protein